MLTCYYRSEDEIQSMLREAGPKVNDRGTIMDYLREKHGMVELGRLMAIRMDSIWVRNDGSEMDSEFKVVPAVLDGLVNKMAYGDAVRSKNLVIVFGRIEKGRIVEAVALNKSNLVVPSASA